MKIEWDHLGIREVSSFGYNTIFCPEALILDSFTVDPDSGFVYGCSITSNTLQNILGLGLGVRFLG